MGAEVGRGERHEGGEVEGESMLIDECGRGDEVNRLSNC